MIDLVTTDGRRFTGKIVGTDPDTDLAVLKVDADNLPAITLGNDENLQVGDPVLAIGNPFGVTNTVTSGIVSALGRNSLGINEYENFIQTDASINPGNSGGALINASGNLVGINTAIFSRTRRNDGDRLRDSREPCAAGDGTEIIETGQVTRGYMGVLFSELGPTAGRIVTQMEKGALIRDVVPGGPAAARRAAQRRHRRRHQRQGHRRCGDAAQPDQQGLSLPRHAHAAQGRARHRGSHARD